MTSVEVLEARRESATAVTLSFRYLKGAIPGQFVMAWIPGVDEVPMSLSRIGGDVKEITVEKVGEATAALHALKPGARFGVRGPYGNGYALQKRKRYLVVAGGSGAASLAPALDEITRAGSTAVAVMGARTASRLMLENRYRSSVESLVVTTDDGTRGVKGFATDEAMRLLDSERFDDVLTCGPEAMIAKAVSMAVKRKIPAQASLERYMKCGLGVCGSCALGRYRVCADGPVFTGEQLSMVEDFGKSKLAPDGRRIPI
jgi:dihydroorotate dehydrogenase electron transfer subunit